MSTEDHTNYYINQILNKDTLKVRIIKFINNTIEENEKQINDILSEINNVVDIKYTDLSCMIIYKPINNYNQIITKNQKNQNNHKG